MRFSTRFILYAIICVSASLAITGGAFYLSTRGIILRDIHANQYEKARQTMREVDRLLYKAYLDIQGIATDTTLQIYMVRPHPKDLAIVERGMIEKLDLTGPWINLMIADVHGRIVVGTARVMRGRDIRLYGELNTAFESALRGKVYHSDLVMSPELHRPTVIFAAPILGDNDGKVKGVVLGCFAWPVILQILEEIGQESEVHLVNRAGVVIGTRTTHQEAILKVTHPELLAAGPETGKQKGSLWIATDSHGRGDVMVSRADQEGYLGYLGQGWRLFLETRIDYALAPIHRMTRNLIFIVLLILVTVAAWMYALGKRFSRPVETLTGQVALLGRGDLSVRATVERMDELGQLAAAFNRMAEDLGRITVSRESLLESEARLRKAYEELTDVQTQLVQSGKLASIGELAAGVAHELNQPLMVIRGTAQLIERAARKGALPSEALLTQLEPIDRNTKRMMRIINHLRTFSRQSHMEFQPVEINRVIEECFLLIGEQLKLRDIIVERDFAPDLPKIRGDANQLEQVFLNLIANSRDAITEARERAVAEGREARPGGIVIISRLVKDNASPVQAKAVEVLIRDAGGGIPEDRVSRIFDPFFTTKAVGKGTGLGLSISYGIIKDHGGKIEVAETGPEGTTMRLLLPVEKDVVDSE